MSEKSAEILVSVIIPVYNYEQYVENCIRSVICQTYSNLEIIIVDDGSTDKSPQIIDKFAKKDKRIVVRHKENGGIGSAISVGLSLVHGDYVAFLDSDDSMELDAYEKLVRVAFDTDADVIEFGATYYNLQGKPYAYKTRSNIELKSNEEIMYDYLCVETISPLSRKFIKGALLNDLSMMSYSAGIDETISIQVLSRANSLVNIEECYYKVLAEENKDSVGLRAIKGRDGYIERYIDMHKEIIEFLGRENPKWVEDYVVRFLRFLKGRYIMLGVEDRSLKGTVYANFKQYWGLYRKSEKLRHYPFSIRVSLMLFNLAPNFAAGLSKMVIK